MISDGGHYATAAGGEEGIPAPSPQDQELMLEAWREVLAQVLHTRDNEWKQQLRAIKAESMAAVAELRANAAEFRSAMEAMIEKRLAQVRAPGRAYVTSSDSFMYVLNTGNGRLLSKIRANGILLSSPVLVDSHVFFCSIHGSLYDYDIITSTVSELYRLPDKVTSRIGVGEQGRHFFILTCNNQLFALQRETGDA